MGFPGMNSAMIGKAMMLVSKIKVDQTDFCDAEAAKDAAFDSAGALDSAVICIRGTVDGKPVVALVCGPGGAEMAALLKG